MYSLLTIHCQPSLLETIKELGLDWAYSTDAISNQIDVFLPYTNEVESINNKYDNDEDFVNHYGLNFDSVNYIELI